MIGRIAIVSSGSETQGCAETLTLLSIYVLLYILIYCLNSLQCECIHFHICNEKNKIHLK